MGETTKQRRRSFRFAFGLRTIFAIVTACAVLLGYAMWCLDWIRQRHAFLAEKQAIWDRVGHPPQPGMYISYGTTSPPFPLGLFGDSGARGLQFYVELDTDDDVVRFEVWKRERDNALRLFPEAKDHVTLNWEPWQSPYVPDSPQSE